MPPWGVNGGRPGARARKILERADGTETIVGNKVENVRVEAGDRLHFITWGGGGWGDPLLRDPALVEQEVRQGWSRSPARVRYGVVVGDSARRPRRCGPRCAPRGPPRPPLFDRGPDIEALRASLPRRDRPARAVAQPQWRPDCAPAAE